jgi:2',3'-cyclic-nucleotide 2'-phosphodiesterase (5'-nucleotidase family)
VTQFSSLIAKTTFPWLIANVLDPALGDDAPIGGARKTHMVTASNGLKIGILGLGEREWLETINSLPPNLVYKSATETARRLVPELRAQGADIIVCLSHMREPNDVKLATQTDGLIDIILGGHDHYYSHQLVGTTHVLRSGSDFKQLSYIEARRRQQQGSSSSSSPSGPAWDFDIVRRDVLSSVAPNPEMETLAASLTSKLQAKLARSVGWTACPLDARFTTVRTRESNIANLVCDVMRSYHGADCALMAAGTVRGDQIYPPGAIRVRDITNCFPFEDPVVFLRLEGKKIWGALENSVSLYPALEGRFPQVSNIRLEFDPSRPKGARLTSVSIGGEPLDMERKYTLATRGYMGRGKGGCCGGCLLFL